MQKKSGQAVFLSCPLKFTENLQKINKKEKYHETRLNISNYPNV